jgi:hypothetical protein
MFGLFCIAVVVRTKSQLTSDTWGSPNLPPTPQDTTHR